METPSDESYCRLCLNKEETTLNYVDMRTNDHQIRNKLVQIFHGAMDTTSFSPYICFPCRDQVESIVDFMDNVLRNQEQLKLSTETYMVKLESFEPDPHSGTEDGTSAQLCEVEVKELKMEESTVTAWSGPTPKKRKPRPRPRPESLKETFACDFCGKRFNVKYLLANHMRIHMADPSIECETCKRRFQTTKQLTTHIIRKHETAKGSSVRYYDRVVDISSYLFCELCEGNPKFDTFEMMNEHYLSSHGVRGYVLCCNRIFRTKRSVVVHCDRHSRPVDYMCTICQKLLPNKSSLGDHMDRHKPEEECKYECNLCQKRFYRAYFLSYHIKNTHNKVPKEKVVCGHCNKSYGSKFLLDRHVERVHSTVKELPWICDICGTRHFAERDLKLHISFKHNNIGSKCDICGKVVKCMTRHLKMHAEMQIEINCEVCGRKVPTYNALKQHMYTHSDVKPFSCEVCGDSFKHKTSLQDHMSQHNGVPRYFCDYCERTFNNSGNKFKHIKQAHAEQHKEALEKKRALKEQKAIVAQRKVSVGRVPLK